MSEFFVGLSLMKIMLLENVRIFTGSRRKSQLAKADFQIAFFYFCCAPCFYRSEIQINDAMMQDAIMHDALLNVIRQPFRGIWP